MKPQKPLPPYDHLAIEKKWQKQWAKKKIYATKEDAKKDPFYVLDMFPYPSGEGLHVGHPKGYIATDVVSRMKRMQGHSVLHPMGFDAFGLPAENYAIKMKTNPAIAVAKNVQRYKEQLEMFGFDYDWSREINTTDPAYYKWTQWIFLKLLEKGLAYQSHEPINWCPSCKTGLANEDLEDGKCERCGSIVEKKPIRQWVLKITDYAERLLADLDAAEKPLMIRDAGPDAVRAGMPLEERNAVVCVVKHWSEDKYLCLRWKSNDWHGLVVGGVEKGEQLAEAAVREVQEETGYQNVRFVREFAKLDSQFYQAIKKVNRFAHFTGVYLELADDAWKDIDEKEKALHEVVWLPRAEVAGFLNRPDMNYLWDVFTGKQKMAPALDWPTSIKELQRNWIGKSEGSEIDFSVGSKEGEEGDIVSVFTTRADTLFGVTYLVLAPEHVLVDRLRPQIQNWAEVAEYVALVKNKAELDRTAEGKEKTGVPLKGIFAKNPATGESVPVWVADYVLASYGTGAVMAVPAHDERDFQFAKKYGLPVKSVIVPDFGEERPNEQYVEGVVVVGYDKSSEKFLGLKWQDGATWLVGGGREENETFEQAARRELSEETGYFEIEKLIPLGDPVYSHYYNDKKRINRHSLGAGFLAIVDSKKQKLAALETHEKFVPEWYDLDTLRAGLIKVGGGVEHWLEILNRSVEAVAAHKKGEIFQVGCFAGLGILRNSGKFNGLHSNEAKHSITSAVGGKLVAKYRLRDWVFSRQRYWGEPIPVVHCERCGVLPVPEKELPVKLPKVDSYEPTGTGESPLAAIEKWVKTKCPKCRGEARRETNTMPQWAGSSWYYLRYMDAQNKKALVDPRKEQYWAPVDLYVGGAEHATRHLIYARFWHKFLYDIGVVSTTEPFKKLQHVGLIMAEDGRKMSKRWGNVVNPDEIVATYGADTLRVYEMFMGPFDQQIAWNTNSMIGSRRFLERVWKLANKVGADVLANGELESLLHKTVKKVSADIADMKFNTAVSALMVLLNALDEQTGGPTREQYETFLKLLAPFAPHMSEELWAAIGNETSIHLAAWPVCDEAKIQEASRKIGVQVNGKIRAEFAAPAGASDAEVEKLALALPETQKWVAGKTVKKVIVVKGKLVSVVVAE